jgi:hypothetical protein
MVARRGRVLQRGCVATPDNQMRVRVRVRKRTTVGPVRYASPRRQHPDGADACGPSISRLLAVTYSDGLTV